MNLAGGATGKSTYGSAATAVTTSTNFFGMLGTVLSGGNLNVGAIVSSFFSAGAALGGASAIQSGVVSDGLSAVSTLINPAPVSGAGESVSSTITFGDVVPDSDLSAPDYGAGAAGLMLGRAATAFDN